MHLELPRATGAASSASESIELHPLVHMDRMHAINALNRQALLARTQGRIFAVAASNSLCMHLELPRAAGAVTSTSESIELHPLVHMDRMQATNALSRQA